MYMAHRALRNNWNAFLTKNDISLYGVTKNRVEACRYKRQLTTGSQYYGTDSLHLYYVFAAMIIVAAKTSLQMISKKRIICA